MLGFMSETTSSSEPATGPVASAAPPAYAEPPRRNRLTTVAGWVGIVAGVVFIVAVVFFTGSKVVHMGDDYFNGMFPFIDLESGGSVQGYIAAIEKALSEIGDDMKIIPGHGPLATKADLAAYVGVLKETVAVVQKGIADGKSLDQLKAAKVLAPWDRFSWAFISTDKYLETVYTDLTKKAAQK